MHPYTSASPLLKHHIDISLLLPLHYTHSRSTLHQPLSFPPLSFFRELSLSLCPTMWSTGACQNPERYAVPCTISLFWRAKADFCSVYQVTIIIMLAMATANSITLVVTLIRPVPQFAVSGVLMQLGATKEATLARRGILSEPISDNTTNSLWPPPDDLQLAQDVWHNPPTQLADFTINQNTINLPRDIFATDIATPSPLPSLRPRSPCRKDDCGDDYYFKDPKPESEKMPQKAASPDAYIEMVLGMLGICIMRV